MSPVYKFGDERVRRKNWYMPCVLGPEFDQAGEDEQARILKATYWADFITAAEWEALLGEEGCSPSARSRLKKKAAGWVIALGRIAMLNPDLFMAAVEQALRLYGEQTQSEYPSAWLAGSVWDLERLRQTIDENGSASLRLTIEPPDDDQDER
jgi:hypothetical protein